MILPNPLLLKPQFSRLASNSEESDETLEEIPATILKPMNSQSALEGLGLLRAKVNSISTTEILEDNELGVRETIQLLGETIRNSQSEAVRMQAIKALMEVHQLLKPAVTGSQMIVSVNIIDSTPPAGGINPILIPRPQIQELSADIKL